MSRFVCACHSYPLSLCPENEMTNQCDHGHLRRVCEICQRDDEIEQLKAERDALLAEVERLKGVNYDLAAQLTVLRATKQMQATIDAARKEGT